MAHDTSPRRHSPHRRVAGLLGLLSTFLLATFAVPAQEQPPDGTPTPEAALEALFTAGPEAVTFTDEFAAAVSVDQLRSILRSLAERLGPFRGIEGTDSPFTVRFVNGTATADVVLSDGAIAGLRFRQITPATEDLAAAVTRFMDRPGEVALSIRRNGEEIVARNADRPLAVGSSFKLAVLRALELAVAAGDARWDEVVHLDHGERSLPSGVTQDWPDEPPPPWRRWRSS